MKKYLTPVICSLLLFSSAWAEKPEEALQRMIDSIKQAGDPSPVVDYVYWQDLFNKTPEEQRKQMQVKTPEEMKTVFREMLKDPAAGIRRRYQEQAAAIPADRRAGIEQAMSQIEANLKQQEVQRRAKIAETSYKIGKVVVDGKTAKLKLKRTYKDEVKEADVNMVEVDGKWLLPSIDSVSGGESAPMDSQIKEVGKPQQ